MIKNTLGMDAGLLDYREGLNFRIGAIAVVAKGKSVQINPTPGICHLFKF
jgi:hypothetical protein